MWKPFASHPQDDALPTADPHAYPDTQHTHDNRYADGYRYPDDYSDAHGYQHADDYEHGYVNTNFDGNTDASASDFDVAAHIDAD